jgi:hypothetical protein
MISNLNQFTPHLQQQWNAHLHFGTMQQAIANTMPLPLHMDLAT